MTTPTGKPEAAPVEPKPTTTTAEIKKQLDVAERKTGFSGAVPNTPKAALLRADGAQEKLSGHRLRWVNIADAAKVSGRIAEGYERVSEADGGRQMGNLALFKVPNEVYDRKVRAIEEENARRLNSHRTEVANVAESIERTLRDKHGIRAKVLVEER